MNFTSTDEETSAEATGLAAALSLELIGFAGVVLMGEGGPVPESAKLTLAALAIGLSVSVLASRDRRLSGFFSFVLLFGVAVAATLLSSTLTGRLGIVSSAVRYVLPWAVVLGIRERKFPLRMLEIALALTFIGHGIEALSLAPEFIELIGGTAGRLGLSPSIGSIHAVLRLIGILDLIAGLLVALFGYRLALAYMAVWGAATAASRIAADSWHRWPDVLLRTPHFMVPWVLLRLKRTKGRSRTGVA